MGSKRVRYVLETKQQQRKLRACFKDRHWWFFCQADNVKSYKEGKILVFWSYSLRVNRAKEDMDTLAGYLLGCKRFSHTSCWGHVSLCVYFPCSWKWTIRGHDFGVSVGFKNLLWPPDAKSLLTGKDPDAGKVWRQEEKGGTEDEMVVWHHWLNGHEFEHERDGRWWRIGKPGMPQSMGLQRVGHDWVTEQKKLVLWQSVKVVWEYILETVGKRQVLT